ncbi:hypothetical protein HNR12_002636 [Streptomonospora nanhaiensis]|uniref:Uncharacterized protein n=1 Tax=Streptomonospora nanhaiensis TaxID=1323731 RepID=A0A853BLC4_9ACTN|nr:hypothetical protein [Streptomonospora nanhaiensis]
MCKPADVKLAWLRGNRADTDRTPAATRPSTTAPTSASATPWHARNEREVGAAPPTLPAPPARPGARGAAGEARFRDHMGIHGVHEPPVTRQAADVRTVLGGPPVQPCGRTVPCTHGEERVNRCDSRRGSPFRSYSDPYLRQARACHPRRPVNGANVPSSGGCRVSGPAGAGRIRTTWLCGAARWAMVGVFARWPFVVAVRRRVPGESPPVGPPPSLSQSLCRSRRLAAAGNFVMAVTGQHASAIAPQRVLRVLRGGGGVSASGVCGGAACRVSGWCPVLCPECLRQSRHQRR